MADPILSDAAPPNPYRRLKGARLTVGLQVQEATLQYSLTDLTGLRVEWDSWQGSLSHGQNQRKVFDPSPRHRETGPLLAAFNRRIAEILNQPVPIDEDDGFLSPPVMGLTPGAKAAWVTYYNTVESELVIGGELYDVRDVASKTADNAARLGALFPNL